MNRDRILLIRQFDKAQKALNTDCLTEACIDQYRAKLTRNFKRWLIRHNKGNWVFGHELSSEVMRHKKLIIVEEIFSWNPLYFLEYLHKKYPQAHIIYWLRNTLFAEDYHTGITSDNIQQFLKMQKPLGFRVVTFDKGDCYKYNLLYAPQAWPMEALEKQRKFTTKVETKYDIFWYGKDKGRIPELLRVKELCDMQGITCRFQILKMGGKQYPLDIKPLLIDRGMDYEEYMTKMMAGRVILDILQKGQKGIGARFIESMCVKKKVITNYKEIQAYDFYRKENIFILGVDDPRGLSDFIHTPYKELPREIVSRYTMEGMIRHIYQDMGWNINELEG